MKETLRFRRKQLLLQASILAVSLTQKFRHTHSIWYMCKVWVREEGRRQIYPHTPLIKNISGVLKITYNMGFFFLIFKKGLQKIKSFMRIFECLRVLNFYSSSLLHWALLYRITLPRRSLTQQLLNLTNFAGVLPMHNHKCSASVWWGLSSSNLQGKRDAVTVARH